MNEKPVTRTSDTGDSRGRLRGKLRFSAASISHGSAHSLARVRTAVAALFLLTVALIVALVAAAVNADFRFAYRQAETLTATLATAVEEHVLRTTLETDRVLRGLVEHIESAGGYGAFTTSTLHESLKKQAEDAPQLESLFAIDAQGNVVASGLSPDLPPISLRDRDYFRHFLNTDADGLYLGKRIQSRVTGNVLFSLARRVNTTDGTLHGVLAAGVLANYFRTFYDRLKLPAGSSILITRTDGFLLFRHPERQYRTGADDISDLSLFTRYLPQSAVGTFEERSPFDHIDRIISYRTVEGLPVVVMLTIPREVAFAGWRADAARKIAFSATMLLLLGLLAWLVRRQLVRVERAETALKENQARFEDLATLASDGFWEQGSDCRFRWLGGRMAARLGPIAETFIGKLPWELPVANLNDADWNHHREVLAQRLPFRNFVLKLARENVVVWLSLSGNPVFDRDGRFSGYHGIAHDVTEEMHSRAEMTQRALVDPLTRLPNRRLFRDRLDSALLDAQRCGKPFALAFIDLDNFKHVNDRLGHHVGDELLKAAAERMLEVLHESDTLARLGGDEFVAILTGLENTSRADEIAQQMLQSLSRPYEIEGRSVTVSASIGVAVHPTHGADASTLLRRADEAMYRVKAAGRAGIALAGDDS